MAEKIETKTKMVDTSKPVMAQQPEKKTTKVKRVDTTKPIVAQAPIDKKIGGKTCYHVSKRDNEGREWKVFIQGSDKVIKLFKTQAEALECAKNLCKNKDDGSYVLLHGLDGKIRRY